MRTIYCDCFSGISGDMFLAALLDLGVPLAYLQGELKKLPLQNWEIHDKIVKKKGIVCRSIEFIEYSERSEHRHFRDIKEMIGGSSLPERVKVLALSAFEELARAEGKVHGLPEEEVHFHEVGAVDSILDIVGSAAALDFLEAELYSSPLPMSRGWIDTAHGKLPLPAPATAELVSGLPVYWEEIPFEFVTPTGAAMLKAWSEGFVPGLSGEIVKVGRGAGKGDPPDGRPNYLRLFLLENSIGEGEQLDSTEGDFGRFWIIESNVDDSAPYLMGYLQEKLFHCGALDVWIEPIYMKKNRPAFKLCAFVSDNKLEEIKESIFRESSTLGVRFYAVYRTALKRRIEVVETKYGAVSVKVAERFERETVQPEYRDCKEIAQNFNIPLEEIYREVIAKWREKKETSK